jgi:aspartate/methionine/tyrosine aminotransferase
MTVPDRRRLQAFHPFTRLRRLLDGASPSANADDPIILSIGEPQNQPPAFLAETLAANAAGWSRYPPLRGTPDYLNAAADWLGRRYDLLEGMIEPTRHILPLPGTREGLFFTALATVPPEREDGRRPAVLLPNPFYHVYAGAAVSAGAEPIFVPATKETGFLPDYHSLDEETLSRAALCILCSPSNPQGFAADRGKLRDLISLSRDFGFTIAFDECYTEIYNQGPPAGALEAAADLGGSLEGLLAFHSLSKRSSAAGLRCGFTVGDADLIDRLNAALNVGGAGVPLPVMAAGAKLWADDDHVVLNRELYQENFAVAARTFGNRFGYREPDGGFFVWLDVGDGEAVTRRLWQDHAIKVLPGAYMCHSETESENPGRAYIRVALVHEPKVTALALERLSHALDSV